MATPIGSGARSTRTPAPMSPISGPTRRSRPAGRMRRPTMSPDASMPSGAAARERLVGPLIGLIGVGVLVLLAPLPIGVAIAGLFCVGFGFAYSLGVQRAFLEALPVDGRGQAFALLGTGLMTMQGLGPLMAGALAEYASIPAALVACGAATIATATIWAILHRGRPPAPPITPAPQQLNADVPPGGGAGVASRASSEDTLPARSAVTP